MKKILALSMLVFIGVSVYSQESLSKEEATELVHLKDQMSGTYQIQMIDTRTQPFIQLSLFQEIHDARKQDETVYLPVSENCRVKIVSVNEMSSANFIPLEYWTTVNSTQKD